MSATFRSAISPPQKCRAGPPSPARIPTGSKHVGHGGPTLQGGTGVSPVVGPPRLLRRTAIAAVFVFGGCAGLERNAAPAPPKKISVRFCWASTEEREGYRSTRDESGQPLHVEPEPFLTEADVLTASAWHSSQRHMVLVELDRLAAARLEAASAARLGDRLAVYIDDRLTMSPVVYRPLAGGKVYLDGGFSRGQVEDIVRRLAMPRTDAFPGRGAAEAGSAGNPVSAPASSAKPGGP